MRITYKILESLASSANYGSKNYEFKVNRRNGYYAIDVYIKNDHLFDTLNCGNANETFHYLRGILDGERYKDMLKPF